MAPVGVRLNIEDDADGHLVEVINTHSKLTKQWRFDKVADKPGVYVKYRQDMKPNTRTHEWVDMPNGFYGWLDNNAHILAEGVA
jgi:hypothetical protein